MLNGISAGRKRLAYGGFLVCVWIFATGAHAQAYEGRDCTSRSCWMGAIDGDFASSISSDLINSGGGGGLRLGLLRDLHSVLLIPEVVFAYHKLSANTPNNADVTMVMLGGRMRFLRDIQPGVFMHLGGGRVAGDSRYAVTDLAFDVGMTVDMTVFSKIDLGLHAAFNRVFGGSEGGLTFATIGFHAALVLEDKLGLSAE